MKTSKEGTRIKKAILRDYSITDDAGIAILDAAIEAFDLLHAAQAIVDKEGLTVNGDRGQTKAHPLLAVIRDQRSQFFMGLKALNLDLEPVKSIGRPTR